MPLDTKYFLSFSYKSVYMCLISPLQEKGIFWHLTFGTSHL